jgi:hypothetical protein
LFVLLLLAFTATAACDSTVTAAAAATATVAGEGANDLLDERRHPGQRNSVLRNVPVVSRILALWLADVA